MRRARVLAVTLAWLGACTTLPSGGPPGSSRQAQRFALDAELVGPPALTVLVSLAGLAPGQYLGDAGAPGVLPNVAALARNGVAAERVETVAPATPQTVHASLVTGRTPAEHGVTAERLLGEQGLRRERWWHASRLQGTNLPQLAVEAGASVAALDWPATAGAAIPLLLPDVAPSRRGETWVDALGDSATPWLRDQAAARVLSEPAVAERGAERDAFLVDSACEIVAAPGPPRLVLLRLSQTEVALRRAGPYAPEVADAFRRADAEVARLADCLARAGRLETSAFVVVGDLWRIPVHTALRPNVMLADAGLLAPVRDGTSEGWSAIARSNGGSAFVYARDAETALRARSVLLTEAERTRAFRVVSADEMIQLGADREAWFGLDANAGWVFQDSTRPPALLAARELAAGGYLATGPEATSGFVAWGAGVRRGVRLPVMRQTDVAPTVARLLGVSLGERTDGRALVGALTMPRSTRPVATGPPEPSAGPALPPEAEGARP